MLRTYQYPLLFTLVAAILASVLRVWHLLTGFEPETELPIPHSFSLYLLLSFILLSFLIIFFLVTRCHAEAAPKAPPFLTLVCGAASGFLFVFAAVRYYQEFQSRATLIDPALVSPLRDFSLVFASAICGLIVILIAFLRHKKEAPADWGLLLVPAFHSCLWLLVSYQNWARAPFLMAYLFPLLGIIAICFAHYSIAAYSFDHGKRRRTLAAIYLAIFFSLLCVVSEESAATLILFLAQAFYFVSAALHLRSSAPDAPKQQNTPPNQEETNHV